MPVFKIQDFPDLPEDQPLLCEIVRAELTKGRAFGDEEAREQVALTFEVVEGEFAGATLRRWVNAVFSPRSTLAKIAVAAFADERLNQFDTDDLVGKRLYVSGDYGEDGKLSFLRPRKFRPAKAEMPNGRGRQRTTSYAIAQSELASEAARAATPAGEPTPEPVGASPDQIDF